MTFKQNSGTQRIPGFNTEQQQGQDQNRNKVIRRQEDSEFQNRVEYYNLVSISK